MSTHRPFSVARRSMDTERGLTLKPITTIWTCRDGRKVRVCQMEDSHLLNTLNLLTRTARAQRADEIWLAYRAESFLHGEGALMAIDQEQRRLEADSDGIDLLPDVYYDLVDEAARRGLDSTQAPVPS